MNKDRFPKGFCFSGDRLPRNPADGARNQTPSAPKEVGVFEAEVDPVSAVVAPAATGRSRATGRLRPVARSPNREFEMRPGRTRHISMGLRAALFGVSITKKVTRNGISFKPRHLNPEGIAKRLTWWHENAIVCQPGNIGKTVLINYDPADCEIIYVHEEDGCFIEALPLKEKAKWFDPEEAAKAIAKTRTFTARVHSQLQNLHGEDSEAAVESAAFNQHQLERVVVTLPTNSERKVPANPSENESTAAAARHSAKLQKDEYEALEAEIAQRVEERGEDAAELILGDCTGDESGGNCNPSSDGSDALDFIL